MFTGIVQGMATVADVVRSDNFSSVKIRFPEGKLAGIQVGASVAINGTCLTVTEIAGDEATLAFDIMVETLRATNLGALSAGARVNYERSARVGDEIGGHNVSGHIHVTAQAIMAVQGMANNRLPYLPPLQVVELQDSANNYLPPPLLHAQVVEVQDSANNRKLVFELPDEQWMKYVMPKGYIAVNGCSLTIGEVGDRRFSVYLIPETLRVTVFGGIQVGDRVNIEIETQTQAIVDTTERVVAAYLARNGGKLAQA